MERFRNAYPHPEDIVYISQKSIGIRLRSTPATYLDVADDIRKLFAKTNKTKADLFSFNGKGGCPVCQGKGVIVNEEPLCKVGLGYLHLNQSLSTFSGGELQRIKLASYLRDAGKIFIMDEPSDGLHAGDIIFEGTSKAMAEDKGSVTGVYLR